MKTQKSAIFLKKTDDKYAEDKKYLKDRDHCYYTGELKGTRHSTRNLKYSRPKEIPIIFYSGSNYYYHFIIKELGKEFEK